MMKLEEEFENSLWTPSSSLEKEDAKRREDKVPRKKAKNAAKVVEVKEKGNGKQRKIKSKYSRVNFYMGI